MSLLEKDTDLSPFSWTICASVGTSLPWSERCSRPTSQNLMVILQELFRSLGPIRDLPLEAGPFLPRGFSFLKNLILFQLKIGEAIKQV